MRKKRRHLPTTAEATGCAPLNGASTGNPHPRNASERKRRAAPDKGRPSPSVKATPGGLLTAARNAARKPRPTVGKAAENAAAL